VERAGLEAGFISEWLTVELREAGLPAICVEARHAHAFLSAQVNKNDRNDARGLARMMMCGLFKSVHIKSRESQQQRALLATRKTLLDKRLEIDSQIRGTLARFGHLLGPTTQSMFADRVHQAMEGDAALYVVIHPLLQSRYFLVQEFEPVHRTVLAIAEEDPVCRLLMSAPAVGAVTALTFKSTIDDPKRFNSTRSIGALLGMTPRQYQSGETDRMGEISELGDDNLRIALCQAGMKILKNVRQPSALRTWGVQFAERKGLKRAAVAVGRRLAMIMLRMWAERRPFDPGAMPSKGLTNRSMGSA
jgi:transposase